jgi:hypothetical protein
MTKSARKGSGLRPPRSPKAGRPPEEPAASRGVRRRQRRAIAAVRKDTTLSQAARGPRVLWGVTRPKVKKG